MRASPQPLRSQRSFRRSRKTPRSLASSKSDRRPRRSCGYRFSAAERSSRKPAKRSSRLVFDAIRRINGGFRSLAILADIVFLFHCATPYCFLCRRLLQSKRLRLRGAGPSSFPGLADRLFYLLFPTAIYYHIFKTYAIVFCEFFKIFQGFFGSPDRPQARPDRPPGPKAARAKSKGPQRRKEDPRAGPIPGKKPPRPL